MTFTYVVGVGSNLGERLGYLRQAARAMAAFGRVISGSPVYETEPVGPPQGRYLNAALALECELAPTALLDALLDVERALGRERRERWGPRTLDLDILWYDGPPVARPGLSIPHDRLLERAFALRPLLDVVPDACDPTSGERYDLAWAALGAPPLEVVAGADDWLGSRSFSGA